MWADMLIGAVTDEITNALPAVGVDVLANMITDLEFTTSASLEGKSLFFC